MSYEPTSNKSNTSSGAIFTVVFFICLIVVCSIGVFTEDSDSDGNSYKENKRSTLRGHNPDNSLTDHEFDNVPYEDLTDSEKRKANIRIGKMLEEDGNEFEGLDQYEKEYGN